MFKQVGIIGIDRKATPTMNSEDLLAVSFSAAGDIPDTIDAIVNVNAAQEELLATKRIAERYTAVLGLLADAIDSREQFNPGSSMRILDHAARFADALGLSPEQRIVFERGALLRDIGKLRVPNDVLLKHSLLTYDEWRLLQAHTVFGAEVAHSVPGLGYIEPITRHHHENFDGTGYPEGLERDDIPLFARAVKIIDVYCAMTSPRVYRTTVATRDEVFEHLTEEKEKHFDPELVELFVSCDIADAAPVDPMAHAIHVD